MLYEVITDKCYRDLIFQQEHWLPINLEIHLLLQESKLEQFFLSFSLFKQLCVLSFDVIKLNHLM